MAQAYGENLRQAMDTLRTHKMRSALTVFGVVLGVSVIMLVSALITGFDRKVEEQINQVGANTVFISKWEQQPQRSASARREIAQTANSGRCRRHRRALLCR